MSPLLIATKFTAVDGMSSQVRGMAGNIHDSFSKLSSSISRQERLFNRLTPSLGHAAKQLLNYATAGALLAGVGYSGKAIMDYETSIQSLSAVTGVGGRQLELFKGNINSLALDTKKSATDVAGSFEVIGSMMSQYLTDPKALREISSSGIILAKASRQELIPTLENLTSIMNQFNLRAEQSSEIINRLTAGEIVGSLRTAQVAQSLQQFGANAATANVSLSESVALVEALAKQRPAENLGIDARNLLIVMDSAKALDKKAKKSMRKSGVDMDFLMDKSHSLSQRLHELSKLGDNAVGMIRVFGERNVTAAKVIFNQLDTYDAYLAKIKTTNEAQHQAAVNSDTLAMAVDQLKNSWINYLVTNDKTAIGLDKIKNAVHFVTNNIDTIVNTTVNAVKVFAVWKGMITAGQIAMAGYNIAIGVQGALTGIAAINIGKSGLALGTYNLVTKLTTASTWDLNAAIAANPVGATIVGLAGLAWWLSDVYKKEQALIEQYKAKMALDIAAEIKKEENAITALAAKYWHLGNNMKEAETIALRLSKVDIDIKRKNSDQQISSTKAQLQAEKNKFYFSDLLTGAFGEGHAMVGKRGELAEKLAIQQHQANMLSADNMAIMQRAQYGVNSGAIDFNSLGSAFRNPEQSSSQGSPWGMEKQKADESKNFRFYEPKNTQGIDYAKLKAAITGEPQKVIIEFKNAPAGTTVSNSGTNISTPNSY